MNEGKQTLLNGEHNTDKIFRKINFSEAVKVSKGAVNSYGLDLSHPTDITYTCENLEIIVIGGVTDFIRTGLKVALKIQKKRERNGSEIYRKSVIDLLDEGQLKYCVQEASARIRVESSTIRTALLDLRERLDEYRNDLIEGSHKDDSVELATSAIKEVNGFLKKKNLLEATTELLKEAGMPDEKIALQLFILGLSRITDSPIHVVVQGSRLLAHELFKHLSGIMPKEQVREATSISKTALNYAPYQNYWHHKTLLLHQLDAALSEGSVLEEYIREGELSRIVTEVDFRSGSRKSGERIMDAKFGLMAYTNSDFLSVLPCSNVICLPLTRSETIREKMYEREIRHFGGIYDANKESRARELLCNLQRHIKPMRIINPYLDQIDFEPFFGKDFIQLRRFLHITNLITLFHQEQIGRKKIKDVVTAEVTPEHILIALVLFQDLWLKPEEEMYFRVAGTFAKIKEQLKKDNPKDFASVTFKISDLRPKVKIPFSSFSRHVQKLNEMGKLKRVFGNNRIGFDYLVTDWGEGNNKADQFNELIKQLKQMSNS